MPRLRRHASCILLLVLPLRFAAAEKARKPTPPSSAQDYPLHDSHDHVTIAAEPGDSKQARPNTRLDYFAHDLLPVRVIVTNDSPDPLTLDDARIVLITADNTPIQAATLDEIQRRMVTLKSATGSKIPLPLPIPVPITTGKSKIDQKIVDDDNDFSFQTTTVPAHATVAGYLYYDIQGFNGDPSRPVLDHATLELRKVRHTGTGVYLDSFEIALHPTPASAR